MATTKITGTGLGLPTADGNALGGASNEYSDLYLADGSVIYFGADQEVTLTHNADKGLLLKHTATADDKPINLVLQTGETDMAANDVIGKISFQAPDEGTGTDAILVSGAIQAVAEGDHSSSSNATRLEFMTGSSEAATSQMTVTSGGIVGIGAVPIGDLGVGLHIKTSDTGGSVSANSDELVLEGAGNAGLTLLSQNDSVGQISFGDGDATQPGIIQYAHGTNRLEFYTNSTKHMQINSNADVEISAGNILFPTASKGIYLGTTSAVAANLLQDYEEGTYDVTVTCATSGSYNLNSGYNSFSYTKIGRLCQVFGSINIDSESSPNGQLRMSLPFAPLTIAEYQDSAYIPMVIVNHSDSDTNADIISWISGASGAAYVAIYQNEHGTGSVGAFDHTDADTAFSITVGFTYLVDVP